MDNKELIAALEIAKGYVELNRPVPANHAQTLITALAADAARIAELEGLLQQATNELNATKDALAEAVAEIEILEGLAHSDDAIYRDLQDARQEAQRLKYENDGPQY